MPTTFFLSLDMVDKDDWLTQLQSITANLDDSDCKGLLQRLVEFAKTEQVTADDIKFSLFEQVSNGYSDENSEISCVSEDNNESDSEIFDDSSLEQANSDSNADFERGHDSSNSDSETDSENNTSHNESEVSSIDWSIIKNDEPAKKHTEEPESFAAYIAGFLENLRAPLHSIGLKCLETRQFLSKKTWRCDFS